VNVEHIEVMVEEPSMEAALRIILPKIIGPLSYEIYPYQCKQELLERLPSRLVGYSTWLPKTWRVVVIIDRDDEDCASLKLKMEAMATAAGLQTRSIATTQSYSVVNRLAIKELEAWYFGDWTAVKAAYAGVPATIPQKAGYRNADMIAGGTWENFERIMQRAGYFPAGLRKIEAARAIASHMDPVRNVSRSFQAFRVALAEISHAT
jgi:Domain of unknown function (DUF4276)